MVAAARKSGPNRSKIIIAVVVVVLLAGAVVAGVLYTNAQKNKTAGKVIEPVSQSTTSTSPGAPAAYPVTRDGAVVVAGKSTAKVTVDVYEDFLCPHCRAFEGTNGHVFDQKIKDGTLSVRYHMMTILNDKSDPPGYSLDAANAALCAADNGQFAAYHTSLFNAQPDEGARGYDKNQLTRLGTDLGIRSPAFGACIAAGTYNQQIQAANDQTAALPYLQQDFGNGQRGFGTPTVAVGQKVIDTSDPHWLDNLVNAS